jgi:hypothetical protein
MEVLASAHSGEKTRDFYQVIRDALQSVMTSFSPALPVSERSLSACFDDQGKALKAPDGKIIVCDNDKHPCNVGTCTVIQTPQHNPQGYLGAAFCWESEPNPPEKRMMSEKGTTGLPSSLLIEKYQNEPGFDAMVEGVGLDYLAPMSIEIKLWISCKLGYSLVKCTREIK